MFMYTFSGLATLSLSQSLGSPEVGHGFESTRFLATIDTYLGSDSYKQLRHRTVVSLGFYIQSNSLITYLVAPLQILRCKSYNLSVISGAPSLQRHKKIKQIIFFA